MIALVIASGPSLNDYRDKLRDQASLIANARKRGLVVICVKSAFNALEGQPFDVWLYNNINPSSVIPTACSRKVFVGPKQYQGILPDSKVMTVDFYRGLQDTMAVTGQWEEIKGACKSGSIRWGPGIMYEGVFPLCHSLGATSIYVIGWDMYPPGGFSGAHFDGSYGPKSDALTVEAEIIREKAPAACKFMGSLGIAVKHIGGEKSHVDIPSVPWEDFLDILRTL